MRHRPNGMYSAALVKVVNEAQTDWDVFRTTQQKANKLTPFELIQQHIFSWSSTLSSDYGLFFAYSLFAPLQI